MSEAREAQSASNGESSKYASLNAYDVYKQMLDADMKRLGNSVGSLLSRQDLNSDGALDSEELTMGFFQKKHSDSADENFNKFLLQNYSAIAGLSRPYADKLPVAGVSKQDIDALRRISSPNLREAFINEQRVDAHPHIRAGAIKGALIGGGVGLLASIGAGTSQFMPAKMRAPLVLAAVAAPIVGACVGGAWGMRGHVSDVDRFLLEKDAKVDSVLNHNSEFSLTAKPTYDRLVQERLGHLASQLRESPDVDGNGFVDKNELTMAVRFNSGNPAINKFLNDNYKELEVISLEFTPGNLNNGRDCGLGLRAMDKFFNETSRICYLERERKTAKDIAAFHFATGLAKGFAIGVPCFVAFGYAMKHLPPRYQGACVIGSGISLYVIPLLTGCIDASRTQYNADNLFREQNDAFERLRRSV